MGGDATFEGVERWLADARARQAAEARVRERWLRQQAEEEADLVGVLLDLAEEEAEVVAVTAGGARHVGRIEAVGEDFLAIRTPGRRFTLLALDALALVRAAGRAPAAAGRVGDRLEPQLKVALGDVLGHAVGDRPRVHVRTADAAVAGELRAVGLDVITVYADGDPPGVVYARLASVSEISFLDSG